MSVKNAVRLIEESEARSVDLRFTDTKSKQHRLTVPARIALDNPEEWFKSDQAFDGSSTGGWKGIQASGMQLRPNPATAFIDPFCDGTTVVLTYDVIDLAGDRGYDRDPRSIARRVEAYFEPSGIGDTVYFGSEPGFFVFDGIESETDMHKTRHEITSESGAWTSGLHMGGQDISHHPAVKGGYTPVVPIDAGQDLRFAMVNILEKLDIEVKVHHAGVDTGS